MCRDPGPCQSQNSREHGKGPSLLWFDDEQEASCLGRHVEGSHTGLAQCIGSKLGVSRVADALQRVSILGADFSVRRWQPRLKTTAMSGPQIVD